MEFDEILGNSGVVDGIIALEVSCFYSVYTCERGAVVTAVEAIG